MADVTVSFTCDERDEAAVQEAITVCLEQRAAERFDAERNAAVETARSEAVIAARPVFTTKPVAIGSK